MEIEVTNRCNLNCKHCYVDKTETIDMDKSIVKDVINQCNELGINRLVFTGGEPTLYNELINLARSAKKTGIPEVMLLSNGLLITEENIDGLKIFDAIQISIDVPPGNEPHFRLNYGNILIDKINLLKSRSIPLVLYATLHKSLIPYIDDLFKFAKELDVGIAFNKLSPIRDGLKEECLSPQEIKDAFQKLISNPLYVGSSCSDPLLFLVDKKKMDYYNSLKKPGIKGGCTAGIVALYITVNGEVYPCPFLQIPVGNIKKEKIKDIWLNSGVLHQLRDRHSYRVCGNCQYIDYCGGCRAASYYSTGSITDFDPNCIKGI